MDVPAFTAEASVYKSYGRYSTATAVALTPGNQVVPMMACAVGCTASEVVCTGGCTGLTGGQLFACHSACAAASLGCKSLCEAVGFRHFFGGIGSELLDRFL